jgi:hypothetical protein
MWALLWINSKFYLFNKCVEHWYACWYFLLSILSFFSFFAIVTHVFAFPPHTDQHGTWSLFSNIHQISQNSARQILTLKRKSIDVKLFIFWVIASRWVTVSIWKSLYLLIANLLNSETNSKLNNLRAFHWRKLDKSFFSKENQ